MDATRLASVHCRMTFTRVPSWKSPRKMAMPFQLIENRYCSATMFPSTVAVTMIS
jgi:hypothetical protein